MGNRSHKGLLRPHENKIVLLRRLFDAAWIVLALWIAAASYPQPWTQSHTIASSLAVAFFLLVSEPAGLYRRWRGSPLGREVLQVMIAWAVVAMLLLFGAFVSKTSEEHSRQVTLVWFVLAPALLGSWRVAVRLVLQELRKRGRNTRSVAIVGATETGIQLAQRIHEQPWTGMRVFGFYDDRHPERRPQVPEGVGEDRGTINHLVQAAKHGEIDFVYIALPLKAEGRINGLIRQLADTTATVYVVADFFVFDLLRAQVGMIDDIPVVSVYDSPFSGVDGWLKRIEDIVLGMLMVLAAGPLMLLVAAVVKLTSPGPVLFRQRRYGLNGEEIDVLKFRTMTVTEDGRRVDQARKNDPRVTPFGALLRRTSLDELPQLFNVLAGDMSIVGPRPHAVAHNEMYRSKIHGYMLRHKVKPGITGWAQVNGWRGETDTLEKMEMRIEHDLEYIQRWRLGWDLKIIWLTVFGSAVRRNAF